MARKTKPTPRYIPVTKIHNKIRVIDEMSRTPQTYERLAAFHTMPATADVPPNTIGFYPSVNGIGEDVWVKAELHTVEEMDPLGRARIYFLDGADHRCGTSKRVTLARFRVLLQRPRSC